MALSTKTIRKSIRSIGNTKKITKAMEMVSAAKMRKTVNAVLAARPYAQTALAMVIDLAHRAGGFNQPLLKKRKKIRRVCIILLTANRGLCGGFNSQIISQAANFAKRERAKNPEVVCDWVAVGRKGADYLAKNGQPVVAEFEKLDIVTNIFEILPLVKLVIKDYLDGIYDKVAVAYTNFDSPVSQKPEVRQILPLTAALAKNLVEDEQTRDLISQFEKYEYLFEPDPATVLNSVLPHLIEVNLYQYFLETTASEHAARMLAMRNASDAAADMIDGLTLVYNQSRQAAITREIAEITSGKIALE